MMSHISRVLFSSRFGLNICIIISSRGNNRWIFHPVLILSINTTTTCIRGYDWTNIMTSWYATYSALPALLCTILTLSRLNTCISFSHSRIILSIYGFVYWWNWQPINSFNCLTIKSVFNINLVSCVFILNLLISLIHYR